MKPPQDDNEEDKDSKFEANYVSSSDDEDPDNLDETKDFLNNGPDNKVGPSIAEDHNRGHENYTPDRPSDVP